MRLLTTALMAASGLVPLFAQSADQNQPRPSATFEVASIKPNNSGNDSVSGGFQPGGRFVMVNSPISLLVRLAYPADVPQLIGAPSWVETERYDATLLAGGEVSREQFGEMVRTLLRERLNLSAHYEDQQRQTYSMTLADSKLGPAIRKYEVDCASVSSPKGISIGEVPKPTNGVAPCGMESRSGIIRSGGATMETLARMISGPAGRRVVDKTGLSGYYEFALRYSTLPATLQSGAPDDPPSIFTALQEQLGLKLQPDRSTVRVVVLDRIDRPTPN
jgi:uncharacterized protein (TIGR03435 family)